MAISRIENLRNAMSVDDIDAMLIVKPENRRYFSGFTGTSGFLLITRQNQYLLTDFRYFEQVVAQSPDFQVIQHSKDSKDDIKSLINRHHIQRLGVEEDYISYRDYLDWCRIFNVSLVEYAHVPKRLRMIKDTDEISRLQKAVDIADAAFEYIITFIQPGQKEREIALELEMYMRRRGATGVSFEIIVASGERSALPHGVASDRVVQQGDFLSLDFGCIWQGYNSDITRTLVLGQPTEKQKNIYQLVLEAQLAALNAVKPGITTEELDGISRSIIEKAGYGENFGHGLGHGVGLAIHEDPRVAPKSTTVLEPGMVITIEPGVYLPKWGGVRIEDMVLVQSAGARILTKSRKDLIIL